MEGEEEEEEIMEPVAGRLEIRVLDRAEGSAVVETVNNNVPSVRTVQQSVTLPTTVAQQSRLTNGSGNGSPVSPGIGQEDPSVYFDAAEENIGVSNGEVTSLGHLVNNTIGTLCSEDQHEKVL